MQQKPRHTFLVHGEEPALTALSSGLRDQFGLQVTVPDWKQVVEV
jgi:predicted metal-dependent RNase